MTSPTSDCLNQHRAPRLEDLILAEVFLAGGPCYIHRLWAEMFERKKSITVGTLLFTEAVTRMERHGLLREVDGNKTAITHQGEIQLFALVLDGLIPDEQKRRLESKGVLGVATQQAQLTKAVNHESGTGVVANRKPLDNNNSDTQLLRKNSMTSKKGGVEGKPIEALPFKSLGVAKQASGNAPLTDRLQVGSNGGGASPILPSPPFPSDDRFADNISRALDAYEMAEQLRAEEEAAAEEGALIEASNMPYPEYERNGR